MKWKERQVKKSCTVFISRNQILKSASGIGSFLRLLFVDSGKKTLTKLCNESIHQHRFHSMLVEK